MSNKGMHEECNLTILHTTLLSLLRRQQVLLRTATNIKQYVELDMQLLQTHYHDELIYFHLISTGTVPYF